jgi:RNA polymerase sigma-70 factor (ECF subfamily)
METDNLRLSEISTVWQLVKQAHSARRKEATPAQLRLLQRYYSAVNHYLRGALNDHGAAEDLRQEFALRFLQGDFQGADPQRGRFRDYLRTVLCRMAMSYIRRRQEAPRRLLHDVAAPAPATDSEETMGLEFLEAWRRVLLERTWEELVKLQQKTGQPFHTVLDLRTYNGEGESSAAQIAEHLEVRLGRRFTPDAVRKLLQRARERFADFLIDEVAHSLEGPTPERLEQELRELGFLAYCRPALQRRHASLEAGGCRRGLVADSTRPYSGS